MSKHKDGRFPRAEDSYACRPCQKGDHLHCMPTVYLIGYDYKCACHLDAPEAHQELVEDDQRQKIAAAIRPHAWEYPNSFCECNAYVDGWESYVQHLAEAVRASWTP